MAVLHLKVNIDDKAKHCTGCQLLRSGPEVHLGFRIPHCLLFGKLERDTDHRGSVDFIPVVRDMKCHMALRNWVIPDRPIELGEQ